MAKNKKDKRNRHAEEGRSMKSLHDISWQHLLSLAHCSLWPSIRNSSICQRCIRSLANEFFSFAINCNQEKHCVLRKKKSIKGSMHVSFASTCNQVAAYKVQIPPCTLYNCLLHVGVHNMSHSIA